ncbi:MAG: prepilin-type N-terminal cleavage/methylation domain-containing protein, partial [Halomonadaceae bacterium]
MLKGYRQQGFTLIELMIVVAIIGVIAAIAYPSYQRNIENTRRTAAQADMMELAQTLERRYTANYSYLDGGDPPALRFEFSPRERGAGEAFYKFELESVAQNSYT